MEQLWTRRKRFLRDSTSQSPPNKKPLLELDSKRAYSSSCHAHYPLHGASTLQHEAANLLASYTPSSAMPGQQPTLDDESLLHIMPLLVALAPTDSYQQLIEKPEYHFLEELCHHSAETRQKISICLRTTEPRLPPLLLYFFHLRGLVHYQEFFRDWIPTKEAMHDLIHLPTEPRNSIFAFVISHMNDSKFSATETVFKEALYNIATLTEQSPGILSCILALDSDGRLASLVMRSLASKDDLEAEMTREAHFQAWSDAKAASNKVELRICRRLVRASSSPEALFENAVSLLSDLTSINPSFFVALARILQQDTLWRLLQIHFHRLVLGLRQLAVNRLLLWAFYASDARYYQSLLDWLKELKEEPHQAILFNALQNLLQGLPSTVAIDHFKTLRQFPNYAKHPRIPTFIASTRKMLEERERPTLPTAPQPPTAASDVTAPTETETIVKQWVSHFNSTSRIPSSEIGSMKMFKAVQLASALDLLTTSSVQLDEKSPAVKLVEALAKAKWIPAAKYDSWLASRRSTLQPSSRNGVPVNVIFDTNGPSTTLFTQFQELLTKWSKSVTNGGSAQVGTCLEALLVRQSNDHLVKSEKIFEEIWASLREATKGDWMSSAVKWVELDKMVSSTLVAQSSHFYPLLSEVIRSEMRQATKPTLAKLAAILTIVSSHDRNSDQLFLSALWHPQTGILDLTSKNALCDTASLISAIMKATTARFKTVAVGTFAAIKALPSSATTTSTTLEAATKRYGVIDHYLACYAKWLALKLENCLAKSSFAQMISGASMELSGILRHNLLKIILEQPLKLPLERYLELEACFETLEGLNMAALQKDLQAYISSQSSLTQKSAYLRATSIGISRLTEEKNPQLLKALKSNFLYWASKVSPSPSPSSSASTSDAGVALRPKSAPVDQENVTNFAGSGPKQPAPRPQPHSFFRTKPSTATTKTTPSSSPKGLTTATAIATNTNNTRADITAATNSASTTPINNKSSATSPPPPTGISANWLLDFCESQFPSSPSLRAVSRIFKFLPEILSTVDPRWWLISDDQVVFQPSSLHRLCTLLQRLQPLISGDNMSLWLKSILEGMKALSTPSSVPSTPTMRDQFESAIPSQLRHSPFLLYLLALNSHELRSFWPSSPPHPQWWTEIRDLVENMSLLHQALTSSADIEGSRLKVSCLIENESQCADVVLLVQAMASQGEDFSLPAALERLSYLFSQWQFDPSFVHRLTALVSIKAMRSGQPHPRDLISMLLLRVPESLAVLIILLEQDNPNLTSEALPQLLDSLFDAVESDVGSALTLDWTAEKMRSWISSLVRLSEACCWSSWSIPNGKCSYLSSTQKRLSDLLNRGTSEERRRPLGQDIALDSLLLAYTATTHTQ